MPGDRRPAGAVDPSCARVADAEFCRTQVRPAPRHLGRCGLSRDKKPLAPLIPRAHARVADAAFCRDPSN